MPNDEYFRVFRANAEADAKRKGYATGLDNNGLCSYSRPLQPDWLRDAFDAGYAEGQADRQTRIEMLTQPA